MKPRRPITIWRKTTADRWQWLLKTNSVSKQETDQAVANMAAQKAAVDSNAANVRRLQQLQSFEKVYAPFDGVITARSTDIGALIDAGSAAQGKELFHLAAISKLRVFVPVPEVYSNAARTRREGHADARRISRAACFTARWRAIRAPSIPRREPCWSKWTWIIPTGLLLPGAYVSVHLKLPARFAR